MTQIPKFQEKGEEPEMTPFTGQYFISFLVRIFESNYCCESVYLNDLFCE